MMYVTVRSLRKFASHCSILLCMGKTEIATIIHPYHDKVTARNALGRMIKVEVIRRQLLESA